MFVCDKQLCNKDLDQGDCAHVCEDKAATAQHQDDHRSPRLAAKPKGSTNQGNLLKPKGNDPSMPVL